jgi:hypothetical protein
MRVAGKPSSKRALSSFALVVRRPVGARSAGSTPFHVEFFWYSWPSPTGGRPTPSATAPFFQSQSPTMSASRSSRKGAGRRPS